LEEEIRRVQNMKACPLCGGLAGTAVCFARSAATRSRGKRRLRRLRRAERGSAQTAARRLRRTRFSARNAGRLWHPCCRRARRPPQLVLTRCRLPCRLCCLWPRRPLLSLPRRLLPPQPALARCPLPPRRPLPRHSLPPHRAR
jgi:hypothetical protein